MNRIQISIDVSKVDKNRLVHGEKGVYLDLVLIPTPDSRFGHDYLVKQDIPLNQQQSPDTRPVLGNAKVYKPKENQIPF